MCFSNLQFYKIYCFRTHGKYNNTLLFSSNERVHNDGATKSFKLLSVLFDEYLSFDPHISSLL
jgi:hypothetical protein